MEKRLEEVRVYEAQLNPVETALAALIPGIPLPVPAWEAEEKALEAPAAAANGEEVAQPTGKRASWRVINRSRYGPKVIRTR